MRNRLLLLIFLLGLLGLWAGNSPVRTPQAAAPNVPLVFASPIQASCILVTPHECRLHVDPFTIQINPGLRLAAFQLHANGQLIYDFRTDVSNPPAGNYSPSSVKLDFAASYGETYIVNLLARDSGDAGFLNAGQAENIVCPAAAPTETPTPLPTASATATPFATATPMAIATPAEHTIFLPLTFGQK